jgi:glutamine---fructose-6-phosphate transaminase (isomerizing)
MCGIVGYVGDNGCVEVLMEGLGHLEYRGYDSAGLALARPAAGGSAEIDRVRRVGPLKNLNGALAEMNGSLNRVRSGIGHTRWATHGRPTEANAHPHFGGSFEDSEGATVGRVAVVHNGIVENHAELRRELEGRGHEFVSETDTEVIAHLLDERLEAGEGLRDAVASTLERLSGSFAVAAICADDPDTIVAARHQSPLVVGVGDGENFLASAVQALVGRTRRFLVIENGEIATLTGSSVEIMTSEGQSVERGYFEVDWSVEAVELGGYEDYMQKEIHEQPGALARTLSGRLDTEGRLDLSEVELALAQIDRVVVVACGTAYHAGLLGKRVIERLCRVPVDVAIASEYRYSDPIGDERTLVVAVSQSGETTDTLAAVEAAREFGGKVLAITNTRGSLITREADTVLLTHAGPEIAVASTKAFTTQIAAMYLLALGIAGARGLVSEEELLGLGRELRRSPERVEEALALLESEDGVRRMRQVANIFEDARCSLFLGRGVSFPIALEGALKLKEISYLPSEGYPAGEMKHGPIALVDEHCPVVAILGEGVYREKTLSNVEETMARGARVITVATEGDLEAERVSEATLPLPGSTLGTPELSSLVVSVPLQLLAYHVAKSRDLNVDKPRNLAKSVTVE